MTLVANITKNYISKIVPSEISYCVSCLHAVMQSASLVCYTCTNCKRCFLTFHLAFFIKGQCNTTFYLRNLRFYIISQSFRPWQAFPAQSNVFQARLVPSQLNYLSGALLLGELLALPTTLDQAGKFARDKHSSLLRKDVNYDRKKFYNIGPWCPLD